MTLSRATRRHAPEITELLIREFGYIYNYIFVSTEDESCEREIPADKVAAVRNVFMRMLVLYGGFGARGFTRYYAIENQEKKTVGFILPDSEAKPSVYGLIEWMVVVPSVVRNFGLSSIPRILRHLKRVTSAQPKATSSEVCLTHIIIKEQRRSDRYGTSAVRLLVNALKQELDDSKVRRIVTLVRQHNLWSRILFEMRASSQRVEKGQQCTMTLFNRATTSVNRFICSTTSKRTTESCSTYRRSPAVPGSLRTEEGQDCASIFFMAAQCSCEFRNGLGT